MRRLFFAAGIEVIGIILLFNCSYIYFREFMFFMMAIIAIIYIVLEFVFKCIIVNSLTDIEIERINSTDEESLEDDFNDLIECINEIENRTEQIEDD